MNHDDEFLKKWAVDYLAGRIFTSDQVRRPEDLGMVFMPLLFMGEKDKEGMKDAKVIYEYWDKAGPRSMNGMPMFMSFGYLTKDDVEKVKVYTERLKKAQDEALKEDAK